MNSHITMKEMAVSEQPCEKCFRYGAHCLSDAELLAVILRTGTRDITALQLAQSFLSLKEKNLLNLVHMNTEEMMKISGIGQVKAVQVYRRTGGTHSQDKPGKRSASKRACKRRSLLYGKPSA